MTERNNEIPLSVCVVVLHYLRYIHTQLISCELKKNSYCYFWRSIFHERSHYLPHQHQCNNFKILWKSSDTIESVLLLLLLLFFWFVLRNIIQVLNIIQLMQFCSSSIFLSLKSQVSHIQSIRSRPLSRLHTIKPGTPEHGTTEHGLPAERRNNAGTPEHGTTERGTIAE